MVRESAARFFVRRGTIPIAFAAALLAAALLGMLAPTATAAPTVPHFGPSGQVDRAPAYNANNPSLAVGSDGVVYLAFAGSGGTATQMDIFFTKSVDGRTWTTPLRVNYNDLGASQQSDPSLALGPQNNITIVWTDPRNGNNDIFSSTSTDGGSSFSASVRVNDVTTNSQSEADVAVDPVNPNLIHVVWTDTRSGATGPDIYYANSTDGGLSFNPSLRVNNDATAVEQGQPAIAVAPNRDVYIVWTDPRNGARGRDIYFSKSTDRGATWPANLPVNDDPVANVVQQEPTIAVDGAGTIYVAWTDSRTANTAPDIYATRSTNAGTSFAANVKVNDDGSAVPQQVPSLATGAGKVVLAWADGRNGGSMSWDVYAASSVDGLAWSPNMRVNDDSLLAVQYSPSVGVDATGDVFAAWLDTRAAGQDVFAGALDVVAPNANPGSSLSGDQGTPVAFDGSGSTDNLGIESYAWDFGDGSSAAGDSATHTYSTAGVYTATLTVWDYSGNSASSAVLVNVRDTQAPIPLGAGDRAVEEGQPLFFDASASRDNVGVTGYTWDFGDASSATTATANHIYTRPGTYSASLTVTDAEGNSAKTTFTVTVRPNALLGMIWLLAGVVAILAIALALVGWMVFGRRKRDQGPTTSQAFGPQNQPPPPPRDSDPLDMTFPPAPPPKDP